MHGIAQIAWTSGITHGIVSDCHVDLSSLKMASPKDLARARDFGPLSQPALGSIIAEFSTPIEMLSEAHREMVLANLT